jgi:demethylmenaquinone methyltransferase/2-methoxy-6-polyprenyl-1,4-benzoquinol methylase
MEDSGFGVVAVDQSREMAEFAHLRGASVVLATAEKLPFANDTFDGAVFGYLLRYVDDVPGSLEEIVRVVRPGGAIGMVEFGRPEGVWRTSWWLYTRGLLPFAGGFLRSGWWQVGRFLGPSIDSFAADHPPDRLARMWCDAGMEDVRLRSMSLGGGLVMWGRVR